MKIFFPIALFLFATLTMEASFYWSNDINNQRTVMIQSSKLTKAAQWRAEYVDKHKYISHCTKDGDCPNRIIKRFGCNHPYSENGNAVESLVRGTENAKIAYNALLSSPSHRAHLLGLNDMTRKQIYYGVGQSGLTYIFISSENC